MFSQTLKFLFAKHRTTTYIVAYIYNDNFFCLKQYFILGPTSTFGVPDPELNAVCFAYNLPLLNEKKQGRLLYHTKLLEPKTIWDS